MNWRLQQFYPEPGKEPKWDNLDQRTFRIMRGGSYRVGTPLHSTYRRASMLKDSEVNDVGFRCVDPLREEMKAK